MNKRKKIYFLASLIIIIPFLGLPNLWKNIIFVICGFLIVVLVYKLTYRDLEKKENDVKSYTENGSNQ